MRYVHSVLAFTVLLPAAGTPWFFVFWTWFEHWRRRRILTYSIWAVLFGAWAAVIVVFDARSWLGRITAPAYVEGVGWALIVAASALGFVADRQIGVRVRSFAPFFDYHGHLDLKTTGAYGVVRHPIYAAVIGYGLGIFLVTGWVAVLAAWAIFTLGAIWFSRQEERRLVALLDDPSEYERYRRRVPALVPLVRIGRSRAGARAEPAEEDRPTAS